MYALQQTTNTWRAGRAAEGARLESVYRLIPIEGSNPSLSAIFIQETGRTDPFLFYPHKNKTLNSGLRYKKL